jgi:hypothetical protein
MGIITFSLGGLNAESVTRENVLRVTSLQKSHRLRNVLLGLLVGCGAGAGIGAAAHSGRNSFATRGDAAAVGAVLGLAGGAAVGALVPSHDAIYAKSH